MKSKIIALGTCALMFAACELTTKQSVNVSNTSTDDQKFAYMLGAQIGSQNFEVVPRQIGEYLNMDYFIQGIYDGYKANKDSNFVTQLNSDSARSVANRYAEIARGRYQKTLPDSVAIANMGSDPAKMNAYRDSMANALPIAPAAPFTGAKVVVGDDASDNQKFSYFFGTQFGDQFVNIGTQFRTEFDIEYFLVGVKDAAAKARDTSYTMKLIADTLTAVSTRFSEKMKSIREEMAKQRQEEQEKLKQEVSALRGDTLVNGMPAKMNFDVKTTGVSVKAENLKQFAGKPLLVFYFSATCGHCAHAAPQIFEISKEFASKGLTSIAVASGGNTKSQIRRFTDDAKFDESISVLWDESHQFGELYSDGYVPKVYLVNPDGSYKQYGAFEREKEDLKKEIAELLNGKNVEWKLEAPAADSAATKAAADSSATNAPAAK